MKKKKIFFIIIGLLLIIIPYFINVYSIYRLLSVLLGLILLEIGIIINKKNRVLLIVLLPIIFWGLSFGVDYAIVHLTNRIPVYSIKVKSSKKVITYNSLFYREYSCDNKIIIDDLYNMKYVCDNQDLEAQDVTSFLNNVIENYKEYKDKFIRLNGKISKVNGNYNLELQGYILTEESINGYVLFSNNVTLEVNFNDIVDLTGYKIYDSISVIGRVDHLIKNGENYTVKMYDSIIVGSDLYNDYELSIIEKDRCENDKVEYAKVDNLTYYVSCLDKIYVKYDEENVYDLSYVLLDKKVNLKSLIEKSNEKIEENGNTLYEYENFKILECANKEEVIIGDKDIEIDSPYCEVEEPNTDEEL